MSISTVSIGESTKASWANSVKAAHETLSATVLTVTDAIGPDQLVASASATLTDDDGVGTVLVTATSTASINLPTAADNNNRTITIVAASIGKVVIDPEGAETIQNAHASFTTIELWLQGDVARLYCDGTGWVKLNMPTWHLLDEASRGDPDISVNPTTAWAEQDASALVPNGTTALFGFFIIQNTDAAGELCIRDGSSAETSVTKTWSIRHLSGVADVLAIPIIIKATNGIFDVREYGAATEIAIFTLRIWGYFL